MARFPTELKQDKTTARAFVRWKGKKYYFGAWGSREASRRFAKWLADTVDHPSAPLPPGRITIAMCVERYLIHAEGYYPPGEFSNLSAAMGMLLRHAAIERAVDFGPKALKDFQRLLAEMKDDAERLIYARTTINAYVDRVRRCFRWCASEELIPADIVTALDTVSGIPKGRGLARESIPVPPVPASTVAATMPFLSPTVRAMVDVQYLCGMRPGEVCRMTTGTIDRSSAIWIYRPAAHKGTHRGQSLAKAIPDAAQTILAPFLRADPDEPLFSPLDTKRHFGNAGKKQARAAYTTASYGKSIVYAIARAAKQDPAVIIAHWQPNQLRHSIATELRRTVGIEAAANYLGHTKTDVTLRYAERAEQEIQQTARGIVSPHGTVSPPEPT